MTTLPDAKMGLSNMPNIKTRDNVYSQFNNGIVKNRYSTTTSNYYIRDLDAYFSRKSDSVDVNTNIVGNIDLHLEIDFEQIRGLDVYIPPAWGLLAIDSIEYRLANSAPIRIDGESLLLNIMQYCKTIEKREQILNACGQEVWSTNDPNIPSRLVCDIPLWSPVSNSLHYFNPDKVGLDLRLINGDMSVTVNFRNLSDVFSGNDVNQLGNNLIDSSYLRFTQRRFNDQNDSIVNDITPNTAPALYWYIQPNQNFVRLRQQPVPYDPNNPTNKMRYRLDGFISESELVNMSIMVRKSKPNDRSAYNPQILVPIKNLVVSYLGQPLWQVDNNVLFANEYELSATGYVMNEPAANQLTVPFISQPVASDWVDINFTEEAQHKIVNLLQKGTTLNEVDIEFNVDSDELVDLIVVFRYNHAISVDNRGNTEVLAVMR